MLAVSLALSLMGGVHISTLFTDGAVLQRGRAISVFGTGDPGTFVDVSIDNVERRGTVADDGRWQVGVPALPAGGPHTISLNGAVVAKDVLVGEVWVASGQSNMEFAVAGATDFSVATSEPNPQIRHFYVSHVSSETPRSDPGGTWTQADPAHVGGFTAVGYWFARELNKALGVPIGILHSSWGGTPAESWIRRDTLKKNKEFAVIAERYEKGLPDYTKAKEAYDAKLAEWAQARADVPAQPWERPDLDVSDWTPIGSPKTMDAIQGKDEDGSVWYRLRFDLPAGVTPGDGVIELGAIDDEDVTYLNGHRIGRTGAETPESWTKPRIYPVSDTDLKRTGNVLAIRVYDSRSGGGMTGTADMMRLVIGTKTVPLGTGDWRFKVEHTVPGGMPEAPFGPGHPWVPGGLWNGMMAPLSRYPIRGAIWYQGESNADRADQYRTLFPAMIKDWRDAWGQPNFPFLFVQLANFMGTPSEPAESAWAELRDAQAKALRLGRTGMATAIDIGDPKDIHPKNKREVGRRLALTALNDVYGRKTVANGPRFASFAKQGKMLVVRFNQADGLKTTDGKPPRFFQVAGIDRAWHWTSASIIGNTVVLTSPDMARVVAVRYAWADSPDVNLVNGDGLPAEPFRTDDWPGITAGKQ